MQAFIPTEEELNKAVEKAVEKVLEQKLPEIIENATAKKILTKEEVKKLTGFSDRTLQHLRDTRQIDFIKEGKKILYPRDAIVEYLEEHRIRARE